MDLQSVYDMNRDEITKVNEEAKVKSANFNNMFMIIALVSILFAILLAWALIRSITRAITESVTSIRDGAMQITSASDQVASSSSSLAQGASEQASSVEEVSATLEESTAINTQNVDNARQADILAKNANDSARAGYTKKGNNSPIPCTRSPNQRRKLAVLSKPSIKSPSKPTS
jgi:methyl-accepting chemotaxis protein